MAKVMKARGGADQGVKPKSRPPAAPSEFQGEVPPHERPPGDRQKKTSEENVTASVYDSVKPEQSETKTEAAAKSAPPPAGPTPTPGTVAPENLPSRSRKKKRNVS